MDCDTSILPVDYNTSILQVEKYHNPLVAGKAIFIAPLFHLPFFLFFLLAFCIIISPDL